MAVSFDMLPRKSYKSNKVIRVAYRLLTGWIPITAPVDIDLPPNLPRVSCEPRVASQGFDKV